jgi:arylsulfatase A-like enzyme
VPQISAAKPKPSLLLITIDTLRADALSCNGSKKVSTPQLDLLARGGVNFTRARSSVPLTLPAHASIMTGNSLPSTAFVTMAPTALPRNR